MFACQVLEIDVAVVTRGTFGVDIDGKAPRPLTLADV